MTEGRVRPMKPWLELTETQRLAWTVVWRRIDADAKMAQAQAIEIVKQLAEPVP